MVKKENRQLIILLAVTLSIILITISSFFYFSSLNHFEYENFDFNILKAGEVTFYHTMFNAWIQNKKTEYNVYIRNDPRKLKNIQFEGDLIVKDPIAIKSSELFQCNGDGVIALANMRQIYQALGVTLIPDNNVVCEENMSYTLIELIPGEETKIVQLGDNCYQIFIKECEVLQGTERFLIKSLEVARATGKI